MFEEATTKLKVKQTLTPTTSNEHGEDLKLCLCDSCTQYVAFKFFPSSKFQWINTILVHFTVSISGFGSTKKYTKKRFFGHLVLNI